MCAAKYRQEEPSRLFFDPTRHKMPGRLQVRRAVIECSIVVEQRRERFKIALLCINDLDDVPIVHHMWANSRTGIDQPFDSDLGRYETSAHAQMLVTWEELLKTFRV